MKRDCKNNGQKINKGVRFGDKFNAMKVNEKTKTKKSERESIERVIES